jgi:hypothetical protein
MLAQLFLVSGLAVVFGILIGAIIWTIKLGLTPTNPASEEKAMQFESFRLFPWPKPTK